MTTLEWIPPVIPPPVSLIALRRDLARHSRSLDGLHADIRALDLELRTGKTPVPLRIIQGPDGPRVMKA